MLRRYWPTVLGLLAAAVLGSYVLYNQLLLRQMQRETSLHSSMMAQLLLGLNDATRDPEGILLELSDSLQKLGVPIVYTDGQGGVITSNLPFDADLSDPDDVQRVLAYADDLAKLNRPRQDSLGIFYYGESPTVQRMRWIPWLQVGALAALLIAAAVVVRHNFRTERERIWAAMARESAHQMATPLSSLAGWVEILRLPDEEREGMANLPAVAAEMEADIDRLEKVARRFEWIGRPVVKEPVEVRTLLRVLERYVRVRLPQLGRSVELEVEIPEGTPPILGNAILLEWALENLIKNALDALAGAGGHIRVEAGVRGERRVEIRVADDGPGVSPAVRSQIFDPGVTTKKGGWGVGLSLARRIVEDVHGGALRLAPTAPGERGATFRMILPVARADAPGEEGEGAPRR